MVLSESLLRFAGKRWWLTLAGVLLWGCSIGAGMRFLSAYAATPGIKGSSPPHWPAESSIRRSTDGFTMVLFAHPRCSCTKATLDELAVIQGQSGNRIHPYILFLDFSEEGKQWHETSLWKQASELPGITVGLDEGGREARRFGVATSGHALVYNANGELVFSGGITGRRGEAGMNEGRRSILDLAQSSTTAAAGTRVFGCSMREEGPGL